MMANQQAVKKATKSYFANLIVFNSHNPKVLFQKINSVVCSSPNQPMEESTEKCARFLHHFIHKMEDIKHNISPGCSEGLTFEICV